MEVLVVADTDVVIDYFADVPPFARIIHNFIEEGRLVITSISVFELYAGVVGKRRLMQIRDFVENIGVLPFGGLEAEMAGRIFTDLKMKGRKIGTQDVLIAGICVAHAFPLLTRNRDHFSAVERLVLFNKE